ncbi:hypothetical protein, variant [Cryptococcus neoformans var. grubii H99]|uniref:Uncharacterized protein n=1 Tax=Cryptococcus neoformans (strain H99 / ATCC 208821 / CBS 10515 / FGSC 9487) TaxID=235443 RepID=T2BM17_CRYN9|nr:hypothetical protein, variant [Cryptococcus neoformans var. grubii H99]AGV14230.1 hypothetical protein, variant [Cryptococcus neoformans var. grubii H99]AUB23967.1 hypothetical protein CKF44_05061 [Cryptococcus neoformans var. grubii]|eukprot:XP_012048692.1 hypothetical protein, variant [Cryptococcus neoformans var. grubii H99]
MGACHSRNHFTSSPSTSTVTTAIPTFPFTSKSYSPARFPNPIVQVPDDRLPEFISTLHQESQCNKLQGISVAYKFNPNNQTTLPPLVIKKSELNIDSKLRHNETNMPTQAIDKTTSTVSNATTATTVTKKRPSLPSLHSLRYRSTCSVFSVSNISQGQQDPVMIVPTAAQAAAPCFNPEDKMTYPRRIRPLFLQEKYSTSSRESPKNKNKNKAFGGVAVQSEHVRNNESTIEAAKAVCEIGLTDRTSIPARDRARPNSASTIKSKALSNSSLFKINSFATRISSVFRRSSKPASLKIDIPCNSIFVQQPAMPQLRPLEFGGGFDGHSFIGQAAKSAADTVSSTVTVSTLDLVFSSLHSPFPSSASSASSLSVYSTTDSYVESSPTVSVVVTPPTGPSSGSQTPSNEPEEPPLTAASTNTEFSDVAVHTPTESNFVQPTCYSQEDQSQTTTMGLVTDSALIPIACGSRFIEMFDTVSDSTSGSASPEIRTAALTPIDYQVCPQSAYTNIKLSLAYASP